MTYEYLKNLKQHNQTIKLLNSDNFAMMVSFFYFVFVTNKHIFLNNSIILSYLDDFLYGLNQTYNNTFPKNAKDYLEDFTNNGYLKKYHGSDGELLYELTPYAQKALEFLESLERREFVGSRSKFNIIFDLLDELVFETSLSDEERIKKLQKNKEKLDLQIEEIKQKKDSRFDSSRIKEHFMLIEEQSRKLKYDFSQIEYNFRELNLRAMEQIATQSQSKDSVLESIFDIEDSIRQSDQGRSFFAFWQILTDSEKNEKLSFMLEQLYLLEEIKKFDEDERLKTLKFDLLSNANKIAKVSSKLIEQLRRFLDDKVWVENRKILELCRQIEKKAIEIKTDPPTKRDMLFLPDAKVQIESVFEKSLYSVKKKNDFNAEIKEEDIDIDLDSFYDLFFVDEEKLKSNINYFLQINQQCTLCEVIDKFPIKKGISELVSYLSIAKNSKNSIVEIEKKEIIEIEDEHKNKKLLKVPKIIFTRESV
jgi:hypothetical protein